MPSMGRVEMGASAMDAIVRLGTRAIFRADDEHEGRKAKTE
jgi:hypothetical protein